MVHSCQVSSFTAMCLLICPVRGDTPPTIALPLASSPCLPRPVIARVERPHSPGAIPPAVTRRAENDPRYARVGRHDQGRSVRARGPGPRRRRSRRCRRASPPRVGPAPDPRAAGHSSVDGWVLKCYRSCNRLHGDRMANAYRQGIRRETGRSRDDPCNRSVAVRGGGARIQE